MTFDALKKSVDKISVTFNGSLIFYHNEVIGRYCSINGAEEVICDVIYVNEKGSSNLIENLSDENEIVNLIVQTIKFFKKRENIMRLERIENDFQCV